MMTGFHLVLAAGFASIISTSALAADARRDGGLELPPMLADEEKACETVISIARSLQRDPDSTPSSFAGVRQTVEGCLAGYRYQKNAKAAAVASSAEYHRVEALADNAQRDPAVVRTFNSLMLCRALDDRRTALREIGIEKKYAKKAGAINLSKLEELKSDLREADEQIADARAALKSASAKPLACSSSQVTELSECIGFPIGSPDISADCRTDRMQALVAAWRRH